MDSIHSKIQTTYGSKLGLNPLAPEIITTNSLFSGATGAPIELTFAGIVKPTKQDFSDASIHPMCVNDLPRQEQAKNF